jgi:hypothetical protein
MSDKNVQSILISVKFGLDEAIKYVLNANHKVKKIDITDNYFRFRQFNPKKSDRYITKEILPGIKYIIKA